MPITIEEFDNLNPQSLSEIETFLVDFIQAVEPNIDLNPSSVLFQFIIRLAAIYHGLNQQNIDRVINSNSVLKLQQDPTLADTEVVDNLLSNYFITRRTGAPASGQIRIFLNDARLTTIPNSVEFVANGVTFVPVRSFSGVKSTDQIVSADSDKLITPAGNNQYSFLIDVVALDSGSVGNVPKGTIFSFTSKQSQVVGASAANDFDGGSDTETNEQLLQRLQEGIATKNMASRTSIKATIREAFPATSDVSSIGAGDKEMLRDKDNPFGLSTFGKADIYVKTRSLPIVWNGTKSATLSDATNGVWSMNFTRDEVPAAYYVESIKPSDGINKEQSLEILTIDRNQDISEIPGLDITPALPDNAHVFTRYQTMTVTFKDQLNAQGKANGATKDYDVDVLYLPQIEEVNDYILNRQRRHLGGDYLAKATIPCLVAVNLKIVKGPGDPDVDVPAVQEAVANVVNSVDYLQGRISADAVISAVKTLLPTRTRVQLPVVLRGAILTTEQSIQPNQQNNDGRIWLFNTNELVIPDRPELNVTSRTTSFFLSPSDVDVEVIASDAVIV